jgi:hypothetical protein
MDLQKHIDQVIGVPGENHSGGSYAGIMYR